MLAHLGLSAITSGARFLEALRARPVGVGLRRGLHGCVELNEV